MQTDSDFLQAHQSRFSRNYPTKTQTILASQTKTKTRKKNVLENCELTPRAGLVSPNPRDPAGNSSD